jgi:hypothetical protein
LRHEPRCGAAFVLHKRVQEMQAANFFPAPARGIIDCRRERTTR